MKHAYLIIAHNEFKILQMLVSAIDDERNDIFVHIDAKVKTLPTLHTEHSTLRMLDDRVDVRWGHYSQIECELVLFEYALKYGPYDRYLLISGTHLPLRSQDEIHAFFDERRGKELLKLWKRNDADFKLRRYHIGVRNYTTSKLTQFLWKCSLYVQRVFGIWHFRNEMFQKSDNWVNLTQSAVSFLVQHKKRIIRKYRYSFCGDEYFVATELLNSKQFVIEHRDDLLYVDFVGSNPRTLSLSELPSLKGKDFLFARKFSC